MLRTLILTGVSVVVLSASAALAADPQTKTADAKDYDPMICRRQEEIGTRLGSKTVCKPRSEWNEDKRVNREMVGNGGKLGSSPQ